jgi:hypothetical protein
MGIYKPFTVEEIAKKLNECISNNKMDKIEVFLQTFNFRNNNEAISEWLNGYGGIEAIKNWKRFNGYENIEKANWPNAYGFKENCLYCLNNYETQAEQNAEGDMPDDTDIQEAEVISVDIPTPPIERIANAVERINEKIPSGEKIKYIQYLIDDCFIYPDGKRCMKSLDEVAEAVSKKFCNQITAKFLQETFLQPNGDPYSESACRKAAEKANAT